MDTLEKTVRFNRLMDFYGELLNARQQRAATAYFAENLSLAEIAEETGISRQGVSDLLSRTEKKLEEFEEKLQLLEKYDKRQELIEKLSAEITSDNHLSETLSALTALDNEEEA